MQKFIKLTLASDGFIYISANPPSITNFFKRNNESFTRVFYGDNDHCLVKESPEEILKIIECLEHQKSPTAAEEEIWPPVLGQTVYWDGIEIYPDGREKDSGNPGYYQIDRCLGGNAVTPYSFKGTSYWTTINHISFI